MNRREILAALLALPICSCFRSRKAEAAKPGSFVVIREKSPVYATGTLVAPTSSDHDDLASEHFIAAVRRVIDRCKEVVKDAGGIDIRTGNLTEDEAGTVHMMAFSSNTSISYRHYKNIGVGTKAIVVVGGWVRVGDPNGFLERKDCFSERVMLENDGKIKWDVFDHDRYGHPLYKVGHA